MIDNIYLTNFRIIGEADINLRDGVTVLIGNNGVGKSTIIEAITFNFYGKRRAGTKMETLRRSGAAPDEVTYTSIDFHINGLYYRCRRYFSAKNTTLATLYAYTPEEYEQLLKQKDKRLLDKSLGIEIANSSNGVTKEIANLFGVSYDGFSASFIAKQKELDSLASLTLESRKKFFLDLLGYSRLDTLKTDVSKELRAQQQAHTYLKRQAYDLPAIKKDIREANAALKDNTARIEKGTTYIEKEEKNLAKITENYNRLLRISDQVNETKIQLAKDMKNLEEKNQTVAELKARIAKNTEIAQDYDENSSISEQLVNIKEQLQRAKTYTSTRTDYEKQEGTMTSMLATIKSNDEKIETLKKRTAEEPNLDEPMNNLTKVKEKLSVARHNLKQAEDNFKNLSSLLNNVENGKLAKCPTCGNSIATEEGKEHLSVEIAEAQNEISLYNKEIEELDKERVELETQINRIRMFLSSYQSDQKKLSQLQTENQMLNNNIADMNVKNKELERFVKEHAQDRLSPAKQLQLEEEVKRLSLQLKRENEMKTAYYAIRTDKALLEDTQKQIAELESSIKDEKKFIISNKKASETFDKVQTAKGESEKTLAGYRHRINDLQKEHGELLSKKASKEQEQVLAQKQAQDIAEMLDEIEKYTAAKDTIEFLREKLPSKIAPRLSFEASRLMAVATNGAYTMLDIDENYEVFVYTQDDVRPIAQMSGGEQDIISLCIRIAIALMILETTGITEQTFVLDEIFGALDDERRASACDALKNLGSSLSRILCITHIDEIKDMADWTFVVEKDENGVSYVREILENNETIVWNQFIDGNEVIEEKEEISDMISAA